VWAADVSDQALEIATHNAKNHDADSRIHFVRWDLLKEPWNFSPDSLDLIVSNPPYIPAAELDTLAPELKFEPREALEGGKEGLDVYKVLIPWAHAHLKKGGHALLEMGEGQAETLGKMAQEAGFPEIETIRDLAGHPRVLKMKRY